MTLPSNGFLAGFEFAQVWRVGSNSRFYGQSDPLGVIPDVMTPLMLLNPRSAAYPALQRTIVNFTGGNKWRGSITFGVPQVDAFPLVLADMDSRLTAMAGNSEADETTNSEIQMTSDNMENTNLNLLGLALTSHFQSAAEGSEGETFWATVVFPKVQIAPTYPAPSYQAAADTTYNVLPARSTYLPNGLPLSATGMQLARNTAMMIVMITQYPLLFASAIGDGTETAYQLPYKPKSTAVGTASNTKNWYVKNGVASALASMSSNGLATAASAAAADAFQGFMYQVDSALPVAS